MFTGQQAAELTDKRDKLAHFRSNPLQEEWVQHYMYGFGIFWADFLSKLSSLYLQMLHNRMSSQFC